MTGKAVVVISGGLDSSTLAHYIKSQGWDLYGISFNYGQKHNKELEFAKQQMGDLDAVEHVVFDLDLENLFHDSGSSLLTKKAVPEGHYAEDSMKATVVPNRNMIMGSIAVGYAVSVGAGKLAMGVHAGDHFIYPDCRPGYFNYFTAAVFEANEGFLAPEFHIDTPFINLSKNDIALKAFELEVDIANTWSCYKGNKLHCGRCGTCVERLEALDSVTAIYPDFEDPTEYADKKFWKTVVK
jgi:7-cyano-7-deazaguanine synthase